MQSVVVDIDVAEGTFPILIQAIEDPTS